MNPLVKKISVLMIVSLLLIALIPTTKAAKIGVPDNWEVEFTTCTNGFAAFVNVPPNVPDGVYDVIITDTTPGAGTLPRTIYSLNGSTTTGFSTAPVYFYWDTPQAVGATVKVFADRLQSGNSLGIIFGTSDTVQDCLIPEPTAPASDDGGIRYSDNRLDNHSHIIPYCGKPDGIEVWRWYPETLSSTKAIDVSAETVRDALALAALDGEHVLIATNLNIDLWALSSGTHLLVQGRYFDKVGSVSNFVFPAALCDI